MPLKRLNFRGKYEKNVLHRMTQAEWARALAAQFSTSLVADLLETHAHLCGKDGCKGRAPGEMKITRVQAQRRVCTEAHGRSILRNLRTPRMLPQCLVLRPSIPRRDPDLNPPAANTGGFPL